MQSKHERAVRPSSPAVVLASGRCADLRNPARACFERLLIAAVAERPAVALRVMSAYAVRARAAGRAFHFDSLWMECVWSVRLGNGWRDGQTAGAQAFVRSGRVAKAGRVGEPRIPKELSRGNCGLSVCGVRAQAADRARPVPRGASGCEPRRSAQLCSSDCSPCALFKSLVRYASCPEGARLDPGIDPVRRPPAGSRSSTRTQSPYRRCAL